MKLFPAINMRHILLYLTLMMYSPIAPAQNPDEETNTAQESPATEEAAPESSEDDQQEPEPEKLRKKELGEAFKQFKPSEEISADNAVPFPIDI